MVTQTIETQAVEGETSVSVRAFVFGSDTQSAVVSGLSQQTNRKGLYLAAFTDLAAGDYRFQVDDSSGNVLAVQYCSVTAETKTFQAMDSFSSSSFTSTDSDNITDILARVQGATIEVVDPIKSNNGENDIELIYGQQYSDAGNATTLFGSVTFAIPTATQNLASATGGEFKVYSTTGTPVLSLTTVTYASTGTADQKVKVVLSASNTELSTSEFYTYTLTSTYSSGSPAQLSRGRLTLVSSVPSQ